MENDYNRLWNDCLTMIREKYGDKFSHWFDVWFGDVRFEHYDPDTHVLLLQVPSKYVYEYLEMNGAKDMRWAISEVFKTDITLRYHIFCEPAFAEVATYLQQQGCDSRKDPCHVRIPNARKRMEDGLRYYLGDKARWLPAYDEVVDWFSDNKGRGLLCVGTSGLGKTLICRNIIPVILGRKVTAVTAKEMNQHIDDLLKEKVIIIDDLGKEDPEVKVYGNRRTPFFELCDAAEREGKLLIITTNLSTSHVNDPRYPSSILERYGRAVYDRLKAITSVVIFQGDSLRK